MGKVAVKTPNITCAYKCSWTYSRALSNVKEPFLLLHIYWKYINKFHDNSLYPLTHTYITICWERGETVGILYQLKSPLVVMRTDTPLSDIGTMRICRPAWSLAVLITYLLTYSMVQSPSWEANWFAASQEIPRSSRNPKVHYGTHKPPPPVSILGQPNPVHIPTSHLLEIHPNIIQPSTPRSVQWFPSLRFPHQDPIHPPFLTHTRHMPSPSHS